MPNVLKAAGAVLIWSTVLVSCVVTSTAFAEIYTLATGSQPGTPIFLDELAPTRLQAGLQLIYGIALVTAPFLVLTAIQRWQKK